LFVNAALKNDCGPARDVGFGAALDLRQQKSPRQRAIPSALLGQCKNERMITNITINAAINRAKALRPLPLAAIATIPVQITHMKTMPIPVRFLLRNEYYIFITVRLF